jgi:hypothetical protein
LTTWNWFGEACLVIGKGIESRLGELLEIRGEVSGIDSFSGLKGEWF